MSDYNLGEEAPKEIREIWNFIAHDDAEAADRWIIRLVEAFDLLARNPGIGHKQKDLTDSAFFSGLSELTWFCIDRPAKT